MWRLICARVCRALLVQLKSRVFSQQRDVTVKRKLVVGNWKMNARRGMASMLAQAVAAKSPNGVDCVLCVPFPYLESVGAAISGTALKLGAQDVSDCDDGAYTGEVSAGMLQDVGCEFVIVGHSERRQRHGESSALVAAKCARAIEAGVTPIVCIGETLEAREADQTLAVIADQLAPVLELGADSLTKLVIAYEPVWAVGTGLPATVDQAVEVHRSIRETLRQRAADVASNIPLLYGGSVKPATAAALFAGEDIDGGLIGGASLDRDQYLAICQAALTN